MVAATDDYTYGRANSQNLAINNPDNAISNADNYRYFAENTPPINDPDIYEPDNTSVQAKWIYSGIPQTHSIVSATDEDWVKFTVPTNSAVLLQTSGLTDSDTRMWLYNSGLGEIEYDDDDGSDLYSRIDRVCNVDSLPAGTYYIKIDSFDNAFEISNYSISLTSSSCPSASIDVKIANSWYGSYLLGPAGSQRVNYDAWRAYRESQPGDKTVAYIYNFTTRLGEFFDYTEEFDSGSALGIRRSSGNFSQPYAMSTTAVYLIREWRFKLSTTAGQTDLLQIVQDGDTDNPFKVAFGINAFNVTARMQDGTTLTTFTNANAWTLLSAVEVSLTGNATYRGRPIATTLTTRLFPRNILSN